MTTDTTLAGMIVAQRLENSEECAHVIFPEVMEVDWLPSLLGSMLEQLAALAQEGTPLDVLASAAEHALIIASAAGIAAGKALATEDLLDGFEAFTLDSVDWQDLPEFSEDLGTDGE